MEAKLQIGELNRMQADILRTDLVAGLTFSRVALQTSNGETRGRNRQLARQVYSSVSARLDLGSLTAKEVQRIMHLIQRLKSELEKMGELF